ncbi:hypothetical protein [Proteus mirabilis]|uniref:hypothetical protein n=1 Tax=Proteus mirabilis TaxID=584 RepID=UPI0010732FEF|nr:hypothetical protein [Proteus mirabilis]MBS3843556.1 hypothetical protein [Proteus mirabilis]MEC4044849.1 hypothetical protein [Proteus mirabilis]NHI95925.1 hypothetical protein [Proteus mirabilis]TFT81060.1 hypothetical protein E4V48_09840 [Proteus mirabilis]
MTWSEIILLLLGNGVVLTIFGGIYKVFLDKSLDKKIKHGLDNLDLLTESQVTKVLQDNIKIDDQRKFIRQEMTSNNISHMRQAWINDLRAKSALFINATTNIMANSDLYFKIKKIPHKGKKLPKHTQKIDNLQIEIDGNIREIRRLSSYLDLLLPFSSPELNKTEPEADNIRKLLKKITSKAHYVLTEDYAQLNTLNNDLSNLVDSLVKELKILLYKEWKVTSSLKELEDIDKRKSE